MNKADKRQRSIRNKLMAAVAMLLVASIMTVTTTYAWFTLSTAPEVQGITTTVGANGNLEIALAHPSGDNGRITSDVGDGAIQDWTVKNLTWGNLLDLSDESYALDDIVLLPSRLNITAGTGTSAATLATSPLKIPVYGSDGRISALDGTKVTYGAHDTALDSFIAMLTAAAEGYGVRAMGTSSDRSDTEINFTNALANLETNRTTAKNTVTGALDTYGNALAEVALLHAGAGAADSNDYKSYVDELAAIMDELTAASDAVEEGLFNALLALASSNIKTGVAPDAPLFADTKMTVTVNGVAKEVKLYEYLKSNKESGAMTLTAVWSAFQGTTNGALLNTAFPELVDAYNTWVETDSAVSTTATNVADLETKVANNEIVDWATLRTALNGLMNPDRLTINDMSIEDAKNNAGSLMNGSGINLQMNNGSGVIANFGTLVGNISSQVVLGEVTLQGVPLSGARINLVTTSQPAKGAQMTQVRVVIAATGAAQESGEGAGEKKNVLDVTYGYVLDFVFRTNAANSSLLLQNEGAQRIYGDSENTATMGHGSTMTFDGTYANLESLISMMSGIRVVFTDTKGNEVYGIAKIKFDDSPFIMAINEATRAAEQDTETNKWTLKYNTADGVEASNTTLYLDADEDANGNITSTLALADLGIPEGDEVTANRYVTDVEPVYDDNGAITHYIWTVKTAKWYTEKVTTYDTEGKVVSEVTTVKIAQDADKNNLYFEDPKVFNVSTGLTDSGADNTYPADLVSKVGTSAPENIDDGTGTVIGTQTTTITLGVTTYDETKHAPKYYVVKDQALQLEGNLYLHNYEVAPNEITNADGTKEANINAGMLTFGEVKSAQTLTALDQNVPTGVSALVYLDGDYIDNSDVTNSSNGISNTGTLNLQFASSADLVPMQNTDLKDGAEYKGTFVDNAKKGVYYLSGLSAGEIDTSKEFKVNSGMDYTFLMTVNSNATVTYKVGTDGSTVPLTGVETTVSMAGLSAKVMSYTIPGSAITGDLTITIN